MRLIATLLLTLLTLAAGDALAKKPVYQVVIVDPYIELHTGPGKGYPVQFVVDRGETIDVLESAAGPAVGTCVRAEARSCADPAQRA